ncbi:MATE family efflux transporter [Vitiosangium sp. GDMCC 1.1324]|uniref:MATE family efflux transporter n=1 Tax=Vitiosangium sp. (strain GDMCC 1.1324) TaxID=2138576 RepID=UPI000D3A6E80|nr:MATE family efflux transporter [Vitiosangium sp. GDMCC 1.1324]PTL78140.1 MATE family efflux transporter [Vitiosangium sp. GDMCC 1.1324]
MNAPDGPAPSLWASLKEALRGSEQDFTEAPVGRAILLLAVPMVLEMVMESIFAVVDVFFVSRLGAEAIATVGLTESLLSLLYALAMGLSIGAMALIARRTGEKAPDAAARVAVQALGLGVLVSLPIAVGGVLLARPLLSLLGGSSWVVEHGYRYTQILLGGNVIILLLFLINAIFRGAGDAAVAMRVLWIANSLNILLCPCLVLGLGPFPELGVVGAAVATTIGRGVGVGYQLFRLFRGTSRVTVRREHLRFEPATMLVMLRLSGSAIFQTLIGTASWTVLVRIVAAAGSAAVAGYTIGMRIILFALLPSWGMSNAAATLVGQNLGARKPERAEQAVWRAGFYNMVFLGAVGLVFILFAQPLITTFTQEPDVVSNAVRCLRIVSAGFIFYAYGMVLTQALNGAGDTYTPTLLNLACFWGLELPLAWLLTGPLGLGPGGAFTAIAIAFSVLAVMGAWVFRRGRWKARQV